MSGPAINDRDGVALLQWAAPRLGLRWRGFKNVRRQVLRRIGARMNALGIDRVAEYRARLEADRGELEVLRRLCFVTISRFYRDHRVYEALEGPLFRDLARNARREQRNVRVWSAGCASGEEPYSVALAWRVSVATELPDVDLEVIATDFNATVLARAREGTYEGGSLRELPEQLRALAFERDGGAYRVRDELRRGIHFALADVRTFVPEPPIDLLLCRNLVFTYFDEGSQRAFLDRAAGVLVPRGLLVVGSHETLPAGSDTFIAHPHVPLVYVRRK